MQRRLRAHPRDFALQILFDRTTDGDKIFYVMRSRSPFDDVGFSLLPQDCSEAGLREHGLLHGFEEWFTWKPLFRRSAARSDVHKADRNSQNCRQIIAQRWPDCATGA